MILDSLVIFKIPLNYIMVTLNIIHHTCDAIFSTSVSASLLATCHQGRVESRD